MRAASFMVAVAVATRAVGVQRRHRAPVARRAGRRGRAPAAASVGTSKRRILHGPSRSARRICRWRPSRQATWSTVVRTTGTVDWDNDHTTQAITQVSGPITAHRRRHRHAVKAGDPLLLRRQRRHHQRHLRPTAKPRTVSISRSTTLDRNKDLLEHKAISQRDFEPAQADYNDAATDVADGAAGAARSSA